MNETSTAEHLPGELMTLEEWAAMPTARDRRRDRSEKAGDYAAFGVRWYWPVDPERRSIDILALGDGRYDPVVTASAGVLGNVPGCEGLLLDFDALWAEVDRLADVEADDGER